jgi:hypothetical protein
MNCSWAEVQALSRRNYKLLGTKPPRVLAPLPPPRFSDAVAAYFGSDHLNLKLP